MVASNVFEPFLAVTGWDKLGAVARMLSNCSAKPLMSCGVKPCAAWLRTVTVSRFVPRPSISLVTDVVAPLTSEISTTTAMTPMMMPSMVRKDRILFDKIELKAMRKDWSIMTGPPQPRHVRRES